MIETKVTLVDNLPELIAAANADITHAIKEGCAFIEDKARERSRVETGEMKDGWEYKMLDPYTGIVFNMVEHTIYNEFGTVNMSAQPMLTPAVAEAIEEIEKDLADAYGTFL